MPFNQAYKTLQDMAQIFSIFKDFREDGVRISDVVKSLGMQQSKVSRILRTLEVEGFLQRNPETGKFMLGVKLFELGMQYLQDLPLRKIVLPHVRDMAKMHKATALWAILHKDSVIVLDRVSDLNANMPANRVTQNVPIHSTATGKCLLAYQPDDERELILQSNKIDKLTDTTITEKEELRKEFEEIRKQGYATDKGETVPHYNGIATPILDKHGHVTAAIGFVAFDWMMDPVKFFDLIDWLKEKSLFISHQLGYAQLRLQCSR